MRPQQMPQRRYLSVFPIIFTLRTRVATYIVHPMHRRRRERFRTRVSISSVHHHHLANFIFSPSRHSQLPKHVVQTRPHPLITTTQTAPPSARGTTRHRHPPSLRHVGPELHSTGSPSRIAGIPNIVRSVQPLEKPGDVAAQSRDSVAVDSKHRISRQIRGRRRDVEVLVDGYENRSELHELVNERQSLGVGSGSGSPRIDPESVSDDEFGYMKKREIEEEKEVIPGRPGSPIGELGTHRKTRLKNRTEIKGK